MVRDSAGSLYVCEPAGFKISPYAFGLSCARRKLIILKKMVFP